MGTLKGVFHGSALVKGPQIVSQTGPQPRPKPDEPHESECGQVKHFNSLVHSSLANAPLRTVEPGALGGCRVRGEFCRV